MRRNPNKKGLGPNSFTKGAKPNSPGSTSHRTPIGRWSHGKRVSKKG